jgi:hypothetical protein
VITKNKQPWDYFHEYAYLVWTSRCLR